MEIASDVVLLISWLLTSSTGCEVLHATGPNWFQENLSPVEPKKIAFTFFILLEQVFINEECYHKNAA